MSKTPQPPSRDNDGALKRIGASVRNLFFYSEEEKAALQGNGSTPEAPSPQSSDDPDVTLLLAIGRNHKDNACIITIDGQRFNSWQALKQAGYAERFIAIIEEVRRHSNQVQPPEQTPATTPVQAEIEETPPVSEPETEPTIPDVSPAPVVMEQLPPTPPSSQHAPVQQPEQTEQDEALGSFMGNIRKAVRRGNKQEKEKPSMLPPLNIAEQIEEIVQDRLRTNNAMRDRHIHIRPSMDGPLSIIVGDKQYEAVVDIEDDDVRTFVQESIREWERNS